MPNFKIPPTQEDGTPWKEPSFAEKLIDLLAIINLDYAHPHKRCLLEGIKLWGVDATEPFRAFIDTDIDLPYTSDSVSTSPLSLLLRMERIGPTANDTANMRSDAKARREQNLLDKKIWRKQCDPVYNGSIYKR